MTNRITYTNTLKPSRRRPPATRRKRRTSSVRAPRLGWILGLTSTAYFMVVLDALVVVTALPRMQHDLHVGIPTLH